MGRINVNVTVCTITVICGLTVYILLWRPCLKLQSEELTGGPEEASHKKSGPVIRREERDAYDRLLHYILHPKALCQTHVVLGGTTNKKQQVDGDKVICVKPGPGLQHPCIVYSFGTANDWSFDEAVHSKFGCQVFSFDPSMGVDDHMHGNGIWFYNMGIGEFNVNVKKNQIWKIRTLDNILEMLGHRNKTIDVLKMDIEGAEYVVIEDLLEKGLLKLVNHLCIEIHLLQLPQWDRVYYLLKRITDEAGLGHFSTRNNTRMPPARVPGNYARYEQHCFEMAWVRY